MEQSDMEVESSEIVPADKDETCPQAKSSLPAESPEVDTPTSPMESSSQVVPSSQTTSSEAVQSNQETSPQATSSEAVSSDQAISSQAITLDQAAVSSDVSPPQVVPSSEEPSSKVEPPQVATSSVEPSAEAVPLSVPSKVTNGPATKKQRLDYHSMSTGVYLDSTVVPILHLALVTLDRLRPADPVQYVIDFLLRHKAQYSKSKEQPAPSSSANQA